jgi:hypothetical protein
MRGPRRRGHEVLLHRCPVPTAPLPVLVGGHSDAALRRAARLGDGWMHAGGPHDAFEALLTRLDGFRAEAGRAHEPFEIHAATLESRTVDGCRRLEDLGVTHALISFRNPYKVGADPQPIEDKLAQLERFANDVISKV